jgi:hypothetical protein
MGSDRPAEYRTALKACTGKVRGEIGPNEALQRNPAQGSMVFRHRRAPGPLNLDVRRAGRRGQRDVAPGKANGRDSATDLNHYGGNMNINRYEVIYGIFTPVYLYTTYIIISAFHNNRIHAELNKIIIFTDIAVVIFFIIYTVYLLVTKKSIKSILFFSLHLFIFVAYKSILNGYGIDSEKIDFKINENNYKSLIKGATPFKTWGDKRLFLINIDSRYIGCTRYLVYDESNEFINPKNEFFGIGYTYTTRENGDKFHSGYLDVSVRKYGDYMYIADACHNAS